MLSIMREASSLDFLNSVHRSSCSRYTAQHWQSLILLHVLASLLAEVSCYSFSLLHSPLLPMAALASYIHPSSSPPCQSVTFLRPSLVLNTQRSTCFLPTSAHLALHSPLPLELSLPKTMIKVGTYQLCPTDYTNVLC